MSDLTPQEKSLPRVKRKTIGAFFTPQAQAEFIIRTYRLHRKWAEGASVLDPTAGGGALLEALIRTALADGLEITPAMLSRLKGVEREPSFIKGFSGRISKEYGLTFPSPPILTGDILSFGEELKADILFGNPPWLNFTDLPSEEKERLKPYFLKYGLAGTAADLLLGKSRIDLAALIIMKSLEVHLNPKGEAYFFCPLSLILNEGAHNVFRKGILKDRPFSIREIRDYNGYEIFKGVTTRCGLISLQIDRGMERNIPYFSMTGRNSWQRLTASPIAGTGSAYVTRNPDEATLNLPKIRISRNSQPRQGINTGGRNSLYIFHSSLSKGEGILELANRERKVLLPEALVYPLLSKEQFRNSTSPARYIFLPYHPDGTVMSRQELEQFPSAWEYIRKNRTLLESRRGVMLQNQIKKGTYWSLMGIGGYTFSPWKIVWESYGKKEFDPQLFALYREKPWIPNQALQAYCSFRKEKEACRILKELRNPVINILLQRQMMQGTCNWAQPGRIKVFMEWKDQ